MRLPSEFFDWVNKQSLARGLDKVRIGAAGIYYLMSIPEKDRTRIIASYNEFVEKGYPVDEDGLSPLEVAFKKAEAIIPDGAIRAKRSQKHTDRK